MIFYGTAIALPLCLSDAEVAQSNQHSDIIDDESIGGMEFECVSIFTLAIFYTNFERVINTFLGYQHYKMLNNFRKHRQPAFSNKIVLVLQNEFHSILTQQIKLVKRQCAAHALFISITRHMTGISQQEVYSISVYFSR